MRKIEIGAYKKIKLAIGDPSEPRNMRSIALLSWRFLILTVIVLTLLSLVFGFYKFQATLQTLDTTSAPAAGSKAKFNRAEFDSAVSAYAARQLRYQVTEAAPPPVADPSL